jgi:hypothetical protein
LKLQQSLKMARSAHAYVRGSTVKFYEWLEEQKRGTLPEGRRRGSAAIAMSEISARLGRLTAALQSRFGTLIKPSSVILHMTSFASHYRWRRLPASARRHDSPHSRTGYRRLPGCPSAGGRCDRRPAGVGPLGNEAVGGAHLEASRQGTA